LTETTYLHHLSIKETLNSKTNNVKVTNF